MHIEPHHTLAELEQLAKRQTKPALFRRFRGIALAARGDSAAKIATALGCTPRAVLKWAKR
jgi:Homeodomain-like domain